MKDGLLNDPMPRVLKIIQQGVKPGWRSSDVALLHEYIRRLICFEQKAQIKVPWYFFSPAILPGANKTQLDLESERLEQVTKPAGNICCRVGLSMYVLWAMLLKEGNSAALMEPDLFEPLMRMFEQGASFTIHDGFAQFEYGAVPLQSWRSNGSFKPIKIEENEHLLWDTDPEKGLERLP